MRRAELAYTSPCVHLRLTQCHNLKPVQTKYCWASYVAGSKFALPPRSKVAYYDVTPRAEHKALSTMMMEQFVRQVQTGRLRVAVVTLHGVRRRKLARRVGSEHRLQHKTSIQRRNWLFGLDLEMKSYLGSFWHRKWAPGFAHKRNSRLMKLQASIVVLWHLNFLSQEMRGWTGGRLKFRVLQTL